MGPVSVATSGAAGSEWPSLLIEAIDTTANVAATTRRHYARTQGDGRLVLCKRPPRHDAAGCRLSTGRVVFGE